MAPCSVPAGYKLVPITSEAGVPHETHRPQMADTPSLADMMRNAEARRWGGGLRDEDLPLITHEEALAVRHWPVGGYRVWRPRTVVEQERGLRAEDSWYVAREQPRRMERPDYGGDRPQESAFARRGEEAMAEEGGWEVPLDARVPLVIWDFVTGEDVNLEDLAWDRRLEGWMKRELGRWEGWGQWRVGSMACRGTRTRSSWWELTCLLLRLG